MNSYIWIMKYNDNYKYLKGKRGKDKVITCPFERNIHSRNKMEKRKLKEFINKLNKFDRYWTKTLDDSDIYNIRYTLYEGSLVDHLIECRDIYGSRSEARDNKISDILKDTV